ncbi:T9SS type A sorting domain-containing protein [bacterium]|nr:T9SS type A sorting domain-containing protein [bacterium]
MEKTTGYFYSALAVLLLCIPHHARGDLPAGRWIHHERQTPQYDITAIFPGNDCKIWVSTLNTLHAFDGERWKKYTYGDQTLRDHTPFFRDEHGRFYFEDYGDLLVLDQGIITRYTGQEIRYPIIAAADRNGIVYFGMYDITLGGVYSFDGTAVKKLKTGRTRSLAVDASGKVWATVINPESSTMGLVVLDGGTWTDRSGEIAAILPAKTNELTVQVATDGAVWVNNLGRYGIYRDGSWTFGDGGAGPMFLTFDSSGRIWGYKNSVLYRLDDSGKWQVSRTIVKGITNRQNFLTEDSDGKVWIFDSFRVFTYSGAEWVEVKNNLDLASDTVTCMVYTGDGTLMCGHGLRDIPVDERKNCGISVWNGTDWHSFNTDGDLYLYNVYLLKRSPYDEIIAHTDDGLKVFNGKAWAAIDTLKAVNVADVAWDEGGTMWIASYGGLIEYKDPAVYFKVNPKWLYPFKVFYNMNYDPDGVLYMQTNYGAIVSYDEDREEVWESHASNTIYDMDIAIGSDGRLWCARKNNLSWWTKYDDWKDVTYLNGGRMVEIDEEERVWASGLGTTGYIEDDTWHSIPELPWAADRFAADGKGRYVVNAFDVNSTTNERSQFYGLYEFYPTPEHVAENRKPEPFITAGNYPNPFNPSTTIYFVLPDPGEVTVTVYAVDGQKVRTLASGRFPAGRSSVMWDSRSDNGKTSASGIYFYRITTDSAVKTGRMMLLR